MILLSRQSSFKLQSMVLYLSGASYSDLVLQWYHIFYFIDRLKLYLAFILPVSLQLNHRLQGSLRFRLVLERPPNVQLLSIQSTEVRVRR